MSNLPKMHTAEYLMWQLLKEKYPSLKTKSLSLGKEKTRADYENNQPFSESDLKKIEEKVNEYLKQNLPVTAKTISRIEAGKMCDLNLIPKTINQITVVKIGSISCEACIGPHVKNTSEIKNFHILSTKKNRKKCLSDKFYCKLICF